ncbi:MAG: DNA-processing protein DprA [Thermodesulfovibrionales bacterium]|nr:DNA-processing protein DprA [Thermodesulfovibrionales bacterium]
MQKTHDSSELIYLIALSLINDIGPIIGRRLISTFGSAEEVFRQSESALLEVDGIGRERARSIKNFNDWKKAEEILRRCRLLGIEVISEDNHLYPENLKTLQDAPLVLYMNGKVISRDRYAIAIVGSRRCSEYGRRVAEKLSRELSEIGMTIISGLARGIDTIAHTVALRAGGRTAGVFASGLDRIYPPENKDLIKKIINNGFVISEFPPGTRPDKENFPRRNRLISGLSMGTVVVEAENESGALITANYALEQGREVFAVPGSIFSKTSEGTNNLIKNGAKPVSCIEDIIEEFGSKLRGLQIKRGNNCRGTFSAKHGELEFSDREKAIIKMLEAEPLHIDHIVRKSGWSVSEVSSLLLELELKGAVKQLQGKRFYINT